MLDTCSYMLDINNFEQGIMYSIKLHADIIVSESENILMLKREC